MMRTVYSCRVLAAAVLMMLMLMTGGREAEGAACTAATCTFTATVAAGTAATMIDETVTLPITIANSASSVNNIKTVFFNVNSANYDFSSATGSPTNCGLTWSVTNPATACATPGCVAISFTNGTGITPGASCTFNVIVFGTFGGQIASAPADLTDTLISVVASKDVGASQTGDFTLLGAAPTWPRKSLAISLDAAPSSVGVGDPITLTMNVTNRSSVSQSSIVASPDPPTRTYTGGASVTPIGSAVYASTAATTNPATTTLSSNINGSMSTITVASTTGYPSSGRILIDNELMDYTGTTATTFTGCTRGVGGTTAAAHQTGAVVYSQDTSSFTLATNETSTITWTYAAAATGTVYFTSAASNGSASSKSGDSNVATIGNFTSEVSVTPLSVISGQSVTVTMTVKNNGTSALTNVTPTLNPLGTATKTLVTSPSPASIASLGSGESGTFQWTYNITGSTGQTYYFSGYASSGAANSNTSITQTGSIAQYSVILTPVIIATGATSGTFTWTVYNKGGATVRNVEISLAAPRTNNCGVTSGWGYLSNTPPAGFTATTTGTPVSSVTFTANNPVDSNGIPVNGNKSFVININCAPVVTADTEYNFPVLITDKNNVSSTLNTVITVTASQITLTAYDEDCTSVAPASKPADGYGKYCMKANLTAGGSPSVGKTINFAVVSGSGSLDVNSAVTDASGNATVKLIAPCSTTNVNTNVEASRAGSTSVVDTLDSPVLFTGVAAGSLVYIPASLTPQSVASGYGAGFSLQIRNCTSGAVTIETANTTLADSVGNNLALSSAVNVAQSATGTLNFSGTITSAASNCYPTLTLNASSGYTGVYSYYKTPTGDALSDTIIVNSGASCRESIKIMEWRELR